MKTRITKPTLTGFAAGIGVAAVASLLLWLDQGRTPTLVGIVDLAAGFPVVIARKLELPRPLFDLVFFAYCGLNGAGISRFLRRRAASGR